MGLFGWDGSLPLAYTNDYFLPVGNMKVEWPFGIMFIEVSVSKPK